MLYKVSFTCILEISRGFVQIFLETTGRKWTASVNSWVDAQTLYLGILEKRAVQPRQKAGAVAGLFRLAKESDNEGNADQSCKDVRNGLSQLNAQQTQNRNTEQKQGDGNHTGTDQRQQ